MGMAVAGEVEEGTAGEEVSEVEVGLEAGSGGEAGGSLHRCLLVNPSFYIERGVKRDMHALVSTTQGIPHKSNA